MLLGHRRVSGSANCGRFVARPQEPDATKTRVCAEHILALGVYWEFDMREWARYRLDQ